MRDEGVLAKFALTKLYGHFGSRRLQPNVVLCLRFKCILIRGWWHLRQGFFCCLLFGGDSLGRNFAEFQTMRDEGVLAKCAIAQLYGHFGSRCLQQNVVLFLHFKCILNRRWWHLCQGVLWPFFWRSLLWSQLCRISENARWGCPCQICHSSALRALWERGLQQNVVLAKFPFLKCKHRKTVCCKLLLHKCPYSRVMTNLARTPNRPFSEILPRGDQGKMLKKVGEI